ncbi:MAG: hypothetical protein R2812_06920 [Gelidibacter sp.]
MRNLFFLLSFTLLFTACDDGDIIDVSLDFNKTLKLCEQSSTDYLLYDTKADPYETLSLLFPSDIAANQDIFNPTQTPDTTKLIINNSTIKFNYRTYDGDPANLLCALVPDPNTHIVSDNFATSGTVRAISTFVDDDQDGIPSAFEDANLDLDDNPATNPTDTDGDGIPDYIDADDDNDNVLTINEHHNYSEADGLSLAQDTDGDLIPDYLDDDDDGDGVITRFEDENGNGILSDDFDEESATPNIPRYLDNTAVVSYPNDVFKPNTYKRYITVDFKIEPISFEVLNIDYIDFGIYTATKSMPED